MESDSRMKILFLCDSHRKIADGKCAGTSCRFFGECKHTSDIEYAKNKDLFMSTVGDIHIRFKNIGNILWEQESLRGSK